MISFDRGMCANLNEALSREWLETNGLGGFASSTIIGLNARRYHGLRSLAPGDSRYSGRYEGSPSSRDAVYHQGTVWAWLMGPFITAYTKARGHSEESRERAAQWLKKFRAHLSEAGIGQISEILDGDEPHTPRGCIAQSWSNANSSGRCVTPREGKKRHNE